MSRVEKGSSIDRRHESLVEIQSGQVRTFVVWNRRAGEAVCLLTRCRKMIVEVVGTVVELGKLQSWKGVSRVVNSKWPADEKFENMLPKVQVKGVICRTV